KSEPGGDSKLPGSPRIYGRELKRWRRVDPQQPRLRRARIAPAMRCRALEIEAVAGIEFIVLVAPEPDFKFSANDVQKFFAFVCVGLAAAATGLDAEQVRLHGLVAPGEKLHADAFGGFEDAAFAGRDKARVFLGRIEERQKVGVVKA